MASTDTPDDVQRATIQTEADDVQRANGRPRCASCKRRPTIPNRSRCLACATKFQRTCWQAMDTGICIGCFKRPALEDNRRCAACRDRMRAYFVRSYAKMKEKRMCTYCRHHRRMPHRLLCFGCDQKRAQLQRIRRDMKRAAQADVRAGR